MRENDDDFLISVAEEIKDCPYMKAGFHKGPHSIGEKDKRGNTVLAIYHIFKEELSWIEGRRGQLFDTNANLSSEKSRRFFRGKKDFFGKRSRIQILYISLS